MGLVRRTIENAEREYLCIEYAEGDQLFVPVHQADRLTRYVGSSSREPSPTRLGGTQWMQCQEQGPEGGRRDRRRIAGSVRQAQCRPGVCLQPGYPLAARTGSQLPLHRDR